MASTWLIADPGGLEVRRDAVTFLGESSAISSTQAWTDLLERDAEHWWGFLSEGASAAVLEFSQSFTRPDEGLIMSLLRRTLPRGVALRAVDQEPGEGWVVRVAGAHDESLEEAVYDAVLAAEDELDAVGLLRVSYCDPSE